MKIAIRLAQAASLLGLISSYGMAQVQQGTVSLSCTSKIELAYAEVTLVGANGSTIGPFRFTCGSLSESGRTDKRQVVSFMEIVRVVADFMVVTPNTGACPGKEGGLSEALTCKGSLEDDESQRSAPEVKLTTHIR
jgi:hypothetical protein